MLFHKCSTQCPAHCPHGEDEPTDGGHAPKRRLLTADLHCHAFFPEVEKLVTGLHEKKAEVDALAQAMGEATVRYNNTVMLPATAPKLTDLATRLRDMDAMGVDVQLVSPTSTQHCYWAEADLADEVVRIQNGGIAELCAAHPKRFLGLGTLALQDTELALRQLEHAVRRLGLRGVEVSPSSTAKAWRPPRSSLYGRRRRSSAAWSLSIRSARRSALASTSITCKT